MGSNKTKTNSFRSNHKNSTTPLQETLINQFLDSTHPDLKKRSKQTYLVDLRRFILGGKENSKITQHFIQWLNQNRLSLLEKKLLLKRLKRRKS